MTLRKKKPVMDFRYYDLPQDAPYLLFYGPGWRRIYGYDKSGNLLRDLHFHNCLEIGLCVKGSGTLQYDSRSVSYHENTVSIVPRNLLHNTLNSRGCYSEWIWLFIDEGAYLNSLYPDMSRKAGQIVRQINSRSLCINDERSGFFRNIIRTIIYEEEHHQAFYKEEIWTMVVQLLLRIARENQDYFSEVSGRNESTDRWRFSEALSYIDEHFGDPITIEDIASSAGLSESYFRTVFRENMNTSPLEYLNMIRVQKVCTMLIHTDDTIENIAMKCGFVTTSTLNRNFRKYLHEAPLKWRKAHRQDSHLSSGMNVKVHRGWY